MTKLTVDQLPVTESGKRMLKFVSPIYENSRYLKSYFDALGVDFDVLFRYYQSFWKQLFVGTVDWGIEYQELKYSITPDPSLDLETRRARLKIKAASYLPLNPALLEKIARVNHNFDCVLDETSRPGFIVIRANHMETADANGFIPWLLEERPAHLAIGGQFWLNYYIGDPRYVEGERDIHAVGEPTFPIDDSDKRHYPRLFAGVLNLISGGITSTLAKPNLSYEARAQVGTVDLITGEVSHGLQAPSLNYPTKICAGMSNLVTGEIKIGSKTQAEIDENHFAKSWQSRAFAGTANVITGEEIRSIGLPRQRTTKAFVGTANYVDGEISSNIAKPKLDYGLNLAARTANVVTGNVTLGTKYQPSTEDENEFSEAWKSTVNAGIANVKSGSVTVNPDFTNLKRSTIVRAGCVTEITGEIVIGCSDIKDWDDLPEYGDWLRLRFRFPNLSRRFLTFKDPRNDLVKDDIRDVSKVTVNTQALINQQGEPSTGIDLAMLIRRSERTIL